jgi:hypothetical protein
MTPFKPIALLFLLVSAFPLIAQSQSGSPILISIQAQPLTVEKGREVKLQVILTNISDRAIAVPLSKPECDNEVYLRDAAGARLARVDGHVFKNAHGMTTKVQCTEIFSRKMKTLLPGEQTKDSMILTKIFDLNQPGTYTIAVARDIDTDYTAPRPTLVLAVSNTIRLTVVDPTGSK